jgi:hypothetical protein
MNKNGPLSGTIFRWSRNGVLSGWLESRFLSARSKELVKNVHAMRMPGDGLGLRQADADAADGLKNNGCAV